MESFLVSIETVKIKDYIFNTNKLKVIRGASYLLDYLNQVVVKNMLEYEIKKNNILYVAAGNAKFFVESEDKAKEIIERIEKEYARYAPGSKVVTSWKKISPETKVWDAIDELAKVTATKKSKGFSALNIDLPFIERCEICNDKPVEIKKEDSYIVDELQNLYTQDKDKYSKLETILGRVIDKDKFEKNEIGVCRECMAKLVAMTHIKKDNAEIGIYHRRKDLEGFEYGETIEDYASDKSFIGFVYADGDSLGDFLKNAKDKFVGDKDNGEKEYREFMKEFSERLDLSTKDAFIETLMELKESKELPTTKDGKTLYGEFIIVGGDDVCGIFPANIALKVSKVFQKKLEEKMLKYDREINKGKESGKNITASSGVVIAKSKTPLHYLFDQSLILQKKQRQKDIKSLRIKENEARNGYIDFQVIGSEGTVDINNFRKDHKGLMKRPYIVDDNNGIDSLEDLIYSLKEVGFPKNKIRKFYDLKVEDKREENLFDFINLMGRLDEKSRGVMKKKWLGEEAIKSITKDDFFKENLNNIFDVLEIYDFVGEGK